VCKGKPAPGLPCNDFNQCSVDGKCTTVDCSDTPVCTGAFPDGIPCDNGNVCTFNDICNSRFCLGVPNLGAACDDGNQCTANDTCMIRALRYRRKVQKNPTAVGAVGGRMNRMITVGRRIMP
jgi:hypothetical protein